MAKKNQGDLSPGRASDPHGASASKAKARPNGAPDPGPEGRLDEILGEFLEVAARLFEELIRRREEAFRQNADVRLGPETDAEIEGLKRAAAATRKIIAALENLKRAIKARSDELKSLRGLLDAGSSYFQEP